MSGARRSRASRGTSVPVEIGVFGAVSAFGVQVDRAQRLLSRTGAMARAADAELRLAEEYVACVREWMDLAAPRAGAAFVLRRGERARLERWIEIGHPVMVAAHSERAVACAPIVASVGSGPVSSRDLREELRAAPATRIREQVRAAHQAWMKLLPPRQHGAFYLDLAYAGVSLTEAAAVLYPGTTIPRGCVDQAGIARLRTLLELQAG